LSEIFTFHFPLTLALSNHPVAFVGLLLMGLMTLAWFSLRLLFPNKLKLCVMGIYGCTHKTVATGIPLINAIYENSPQIGSYTLPIIIWHSLQLVLGSLVAPKIAAFVAREEERQRNATSSVDEESPAREQDHQFDESQPTPDPSTTVEEQEQQALEEGRVQTQVIMKGIMAPEEEEAIESST
jgi:SBF-like CPA transporter family (DUF4137)